MNKLTNEQFNKCKEQFLALGEKALYLNHYQLAMETHIEDPMIWKAFLVDPRIADYVQSEMDIIRGASINEIIQKAPNSKSVGQAQLINALVKIDETAANKDGPVFIYSYVPLNAEQEFAPNTQTMIIEPEEPEIEIEIPETTEKTEEGDWELDDEKLKLANLSNRRR